MTITPLESKSPVGGHQIDTGSHLPLGHASDVTGLCQPRGIELNGRLRLVAGCARIKSESQTAAPR